jgi:hypothetical protein
MQISAGPHFTCFGYLSKKINDFTITKKEKKERVSEMGKIKTG